MKNKREVLTIGEAAKVCRVASRTVTQWCEKGTLKYYRIPPPDGGRGRGHRRITVNELIVFMRNNSLPLPWVKELEDYGKGISPTPWTTTNP